MKRMLGLALAALLLSMFAAPAVAAEKDSKAPSLGKIRHVVLFAWKADAPRKKVAEIEDAFRALPKKIPEIAGFEWGTNNSPEGLNDGFTHCFLVTFEDEKAREVYLPHPAHKAFVELMKPYMEKVLVIDYVAKD